MVPVIDSANAMGHDQMSGATMMNTVPGTPNGCSAAYAATNAREVTGSLPSRVSTRRSCAMGGEGAPVRALETYHGMLGEHFRRHDGEPERALLDELAAQISEDEVPMVAEASIREPGAAGRTRRGPAPSSRRCSPRCPPSSPRTVLRSSSCTMRYIDSRGRSSPRGRSS